MEEARQDDGEFRGWLRGKIETISADIADIKMGMQNLDAQLDLHNARITSNEQWRENHEKQIERDYQKKELSSKRKQLSWQRVGIVAAVILGVASMVTAWLLNS